jgi:putative glutamine amidotransferase
MVTTYTPVIGITADTAAHPEERDEPAYMVRRNYVDALCLAGARAVILPYDTERAEESVAMIDGLLVTGGRFDLPPGWYGGQPGRKDAILKEDRSLAERALIAAALKADMPVLGVCNGMQLLGVMHGAAMIEHIPDEGPHALDHMAADTPARGQHEVMFQPGCALGAIVGVTSAPVNSVHHQALRSAPGFRIAALAPDGIIEAIEIPGYRFCHGLQWHPEYGVSPADGAILQAFVEAARHFRQHSKPASAA